METRICGIPCIVELTNYRYTKPNPRADNPDDYYGGFDDIEYKVLTTKGKPAAWLERKIKDDDHRRLVDELIDELCKGVDYD